MYAFNISICNGGILSDCILSNPRILDPRIFYNRTLSPSILNSCRVIRILNHRIMDHRTLQCPSVHIQTSSTMYAAHCPMRSSALQAQDPSDLMGRGMTPVGIVEALLDGLGGVGALTYKRPAFLCHCSDERVYQALRLLRKSEVCVFLLLAPKFCSTCSDELLPALLLIQLLVLTLVSMVLILL